MNTKELDFNVQMPTTDYHPERLKPLEWREVKGDGGKFFQVEKNPFFKFTLRKDEYGTFIAENQISEQTEIKNLVPNGVRIPYRGWARLSICFREFDNAKDYIQMEYSRIIYHLIKALDACEKHGFPKKVFPKNEGEEELGELEYFDSLEDSVGLVIFYGNYFVCEWLSKDKWSSLSPEYSSPEEAKDAFFKGTRELIKKLSIE